MMIVLGLRNIRDLCNLNERQWKEITKIFKGVIITENKPDNKRRPDDPGRRRKILDFHRAGALFEFENGDGMMITIKVRWNVPLYYSSVSQYTSATL